MDGSGCTIQILATQIRVINGYISLGTIQIQHFFTLLPTTNGMLGIIIIVSITLDPNDLRFDQNYPSSTSDPRDLTWNN